MLISRFTKNNCLTGCGIIDLFEKKYFLYNVSKNLQQNLINEIDSSIVSNSIDTLLNDLMKDKIEDLEIIYENIKYHITSSLNQKKKEYNDISRIDLGEWEKF